MALLIVVSHMATTNTFITLIIPTTMPNRPTHLSPSNLAIPSKIGSLHLPSINWDDFKGEAPEDSPYLAHIYWAISYHYPPPIAPSLQQTVSTSVSILNRSWVRNQDRPGLLQHQYGHLLIGCLCALQFERRVNWELKRDPSLNMGSWCRIILAECLKEYCALQRRYDDETNHNLNKEAQRQWQEWIREQMGRHLKDFQLKAKMKQPKGSKKNKQKRRVVSIGGNKSCPKPCLPRLKPQRRPLHKI